ncbi:MAG TPA: helix-turn-helix transcriptional regulator [Longimicrobium sp.]|nr:helix-turn-helix transcriptional regulator [Longimicrobium sp.]
MPEERQERIRRMSDGLMAEMPLHELRRARELSQEHLASAMNQSQSAISRLERRTDMYLSTLRRYVRALGGELDIIARFPEGSVRVDQFTALGEDDPSEAAA